MIPPFLVMSYNSLTPFLSLSFLLMCSASGGGHAGRGERDRFARLLQISQILNMDRVDDATEALGPGSKLTPEDVVQVIRLRVDYTDSDIDRMAGILHQQHSTRWLFTKIKFEHLSDGYPKKDPDTPSSFGLFFLLCWCLFLLFFFLLPPLAGTFALKSFRCWLVDFWSWQTFFHVDPWGWSVLEEDMIPPSTNLRVLWDPLLGVTAYLALLNLIFTRFIIRSVLIFTPCCIFPQTPFLST